MNRNEVESLVLGRLRSFIGQPKAEISNHLKASGIPEAFICEGTWDDTKQDYIVVHSSIVGRLVFSAELKNDQCIAQTILIDSEDYRDCLSLLKGMGFTYNAKSKRWSKAGEPYIWRIEECATGYSLITRRLLKMTTCKTHTFAQFNLAARTN